MAVFDRGILAALAKAATGYRGAETCDLRPEWACDPGDHDLLAMLGACHAADWDELTPQLALADILDERGDPRAAWVRAGCDLWAACRDLPGHTGGWDYERAQAALAPACESVAGWRVSCLWGVLVAWHAPAGDGSGPMGRTWVDARVPAAVRGVWWWSVGLARSQAYAARSQAYAAWSQADAAGSQAYAAGRQADAVRRQADVWAFARAAWELCGAKIPMLAREGD